MCGRTSCTRAPGEISEACTFRSKSNQLSKPKWANLGSSTYKPSYNNGPKSCSPILVKNKFVESKDEAEESERIVVPMQWGLIPSWHKGSAKEFSYNMINCRKDTITEKKSFLKALENGQRCVVLADGFYEWQTSNKEEKQPYFLQLKDDIAPHQRSVKGDITPHLGSVKDDITPPQGSMKDDITPHHGSVEEGKSSKQLIVMAGLFDKHISKEEGLLYSYTIITVDSSPELNWLHHRMPAILETEDAVEKWLDVDNIPYKKALELLRPTDSLTWYPVSSFVNNSRNNSMECIKKIDLKKLTAKKKASSNLMSSWLKKDGKRKSDEGEVKSLKKLKSGF